MPHLFLAVWKPMYILEGQREISRRKKYGNTFGEWGVEVRFKLEKSVYRNFRTKEISECCWGCKRGRFCVAAGTCVGVGVGWNHRTRQGSDHGLCTMSLIHAFSFQHSVITFAAGFAVWIHILKNSYLPKLQKKAGDFTSYSGVCVSTSASVVSYTPADTMPWFSQTRFYLQTVLHVTILGMETVFPERGSLFLKVQVGGVLSLLVWLRRLLCTLTAV